jgi:hypothetical protein
VFIQVIQGKCTRQDELRTLAESWRDETGAGTTGWLGGTFGFTDDDDFIGVVRFESREAAMANSGRPEQGAWAEKMSALMDGPVEYHDCDDVTTFLDGGSDDAGFVQVMRGHTHDPAGAKAMLAGSSEPLREMRPEIIGGTFALEPDGTFTQTVAFTSEDSARSGEQQAPPEDIAAQMESLFHVEHYYDLHKPWFESP